MYQIFLANVFITLISIPIMSIIFGPAGLGSVKTAEQVLEKYHERGIKACEIAFVHQIYIKNKDDATKIKSIREETTSFLPRHYTHSSRIAFFNLSIRHSSI